MIKGVPLRWAQCALGHSSKLVAFAYSKGAKLVAPSLEEYDPSNENIVNGTALVA